MKAIKFILASGAGLAALVAAAPASAQYYPGYGDGNVVGQVLGQILGGGMGGYGGGGYGGGYGGGSQMAVNQCSAAVSQRLSGGYAGQGGYGYAGQGGYGYGGGARVQVTSVEPRSSGKMRVRGVAQTNDGGYGQNVAFKCNVDYRGRISDIDFDRMAQGYGGYGSNGGYNQGYGQGYSNGYAPYGTYRRY